MVKQECARVSGGLQSPSCTSSMDRSPSSDLSRSLSPSHSFSHRADPPEGWQEEHSSANLVDVVGQIRNICCLPPTPSDSRKMCCFKVALDAEDQPSSSYRLPIGDSSSDTLADLDNSYLLCQIWDEV